MNDKELLELAAKAAGYNVRWHENWQCFVHVEPFNTDNPPTLAGQRMVWTPLTDDGDALRLAVELGMFVQVTIAGAIVDSLVEVEDESYTRRVIETWVEHGGDKLSATRRAIVLAAAEIGKRL